MIGLTITLGLIVLVIWSLHWIADRKEEAAYQEQLRLARADGLPTNATEFAATIPPARPEENAAPLYRMLRSLRQKGDDPQTLERNLIFHPNVKNLAAAQALLNARHDYMQTLDKAVARP